MSHDPDDDNGGGNDPELETFLFFRDNASDRAIVMQGDPAAAIDAGYTEPLWTEITEAEYQDAVNAEAVKGLRLASAVAKLAASAGLDQNEAAALLAFFKGEVRL